MVWHNVLNVLQAWCALLERDSLRAHAAVHGARSCTTTSSQGLSTGVVFGSQDLIPVAAPHRSHSTRLSHIWPITTVKINLSHVAIYTLHTTARVHQVQTELQVSTPWPRRQHVRAPRCGYTPSPHPPALTPAEHTHQPHRSGQVQPSAPSRGVRGMPVPSPPPPPIHTHTPLSTHKHTHSQTPSHASPPPLGPHT